MDPPPYSDGSLNGVAGLFRGLALRGQYVGDRLIMALDFGTTYSGVAYAFSNDPEKVHIIDSFPGGDRIAPKAPTSIRYDPGSKTNFQWGYELDRSSEEKIERMKLLFDPEQPRPYFITDNIEAEMAKLPKDVTEVASDYMRAMVKHAMAEIESGELSMEFLSSAFEKQYVLTVPAVWSDKAKDMTLRAAKLAGISPVEMITEPEAAAIFTLASVKNRGLKEKDAILICDAGGGTVDLISYEIVSLSPFEVKGLTKPSGGIAGSSMINKLLEEEIRKAVGDDAYVKLKKTDGYRNALREFDIAIKVSFKDKNDKDKYLAFPMANLKDNPSRGIEKNAMRLSGATVFRLFDPIIREVDRLVTEQVNNVKIERLQASPSNPNGVKAIFLVGGFGSSNYLREVIMKSNPGITVIQPKEAWASIARGAVMSKLPTTLAPSVISSKAPKHYGTNCNSPYDHRRDKGFPMLTDIWDGSLKCNVMSWFINMNEELERGKKTKHRFYRSFAGHDPSGKALVITDELYESTASHAPEHPGEDVKPNCELVTDLSKVPKSHFKQKTRASDGAAYCDLSYNLQIESNKSGLLTYSLEIDGKEYSAVDAKY